MPLSPSPHRDTPLICDIETLLLDPAPAIAQALQLTAQQVGAHVTLPAAAVLRQTPLAGLLRDLLALRGADGDLLRLARAAAVYGQHYTASRNRATLWPGALALLQSIADQAGLQLHYMTHLGVETAAALLDHHGLHPYVRRLCAPQHEHAPGLRPRLLRALIDDSPWPAQQWLLLSDHPLELQHARSAGLRTLGLAYGRGNAHALAAAAPDYIATSPLDVECHLAHWAGTAPLCRARPLRQLN